MALLRVDSKPSDRKIDLAVAMVMAFDRATRHEEAPIDWASQVL